MPCRQLIIACLTLMGVATLSGCAPSYHTVNLSSGAIATPLGWEAVRVGGNLRVTQKTGTVYVGTVAAFADSVVLMIADSGAVSRRAFHRDEIVAAQYSPNDEHGRHQRSTFRLSLAMAAIVLPVLASIALMTR